MYTTECSDIKAMPHSAWLALKHLLLYNSWKSWARPEGAKILKGGERRHSTTGCSTYFVVNEGNPMIILYCVDDHLVLLFLLQMGKVDYCDCVDDLDRQ